MKKVVKGRKGQRGPKGQRSIGFKMKVAHDYVSGEDSLRQVALRYGVNNVNVISWVKRYYPELSSDNVSKTEVMTEEEQKEFEALKKQNEELKKRLEHADLKATAFEIMIDIAEKQLGIDIKKKSGIKLP